MSGDIRFPHSWQWELLKTFIRLEPASGQGPSAPLSISP